MVLISDRERHNIFCKIITFLPHRSLLTCMLTSKVYLQFILVNIRHVALYRNSFSSNHHRLNLQLAVMNFSKLQSFTYNGPILLEDAVKISYLTQIIKLSLTITNRFETPLLDPLENITVNPPKTCQITYSALFWLQHVALLETLVFHRSGWRPFIALDSLRHLTNLQKLNLNVEAKNCDSIRYLVNLVELSIARYISSSFDDPFEPIYALTKLGKLTISRYFRYYNVTETRRTHALTIPLENLCNLPDLEE
eukprot:Awhi_evm1s10030